MNYRRTYLACCWRWYLTHPWEFIDEFYKEIQAFLQRGWRGYADCDIWGFHDYLNDILAGGLRRLAKGSSYPGRGEMDTWNKWKNALEANAKRFENVSHYDEVGWEKDKDFKLGKNVYREQDKALTFVKKWFRDLWD